jgi:hypothetical protein
MSVDRRTAASQPAKGASDVTSDRHSESQAVIAHFDSPLTIRLNIVGLETDRKFLFC